MSEARRSAPGRASLPSDEEERLRALRELGLLDTPAKERFDASPGWPAGSSTCRSP